MRKIDKLIIHCTATPEGREVSVNTIRKWHLDRGWRDIGYHFVIDLLGEVHEGRPIEQTGAHTKGHNFDSIGIAYVGGVEAKKIDGKWVPKDTRTELQKEALDDLLCYLKILYASAKVYGHNDFSTKACPSFNARAEYEWISNQF